MRLRFEIHVERKNKVVKLSCVGIALELAISQHPEEL
jgi:hypothetical protein